MILQRTNFKASGVFGTLRFDDDLEFCKTLEHAYSGQGGFYPKLPSGNYPCVRGVHQLQTGGAFLTFEVMGVPGHSGILFHPGNANRDSAGCILLGAEIKDDALLQSRTTFLDFMNKMSGVDIFQLVVI